MLRTAFSRDITETIPARLGLNNAAAASLNNSGTGWDVAIGGQPFHLMTSDAFPQQMETAPFQRQQIDQAVTPGDQTLTGAWTRSMMSFHGGSGLKYADLRPWDPLTPYRYADSYGIDPWTEGQLSLLPDTAKVHDSTSVPYVATLDNGYFYADGTNLTRVAADGTTAAYTTGLPAIATSLCTNGSTWFVGSVSGIYSGPYDETVTGTRLWPTAGGLPVLVRVVKDRLIAAIGPSLYELSLAGAGVLPAPFFTHPDPAWSWTCIIDSPSAILVIGRSHGVCTIHKITLDTAGLLPTLTKPNVIAEMPRGESINDAATYLSQFLGLATTAGFRVAAIDNSGNVTYGPLLISLPGGASGIGFWDKQAWVGSGATGECYRVDLGRPMQEQVATYSSYYSPVASRYGYTRDVRFFTGTYGTSALATGTITSLAMLGTRPVVAISGRGVWRASATATVPYGTIDTPRLRFGTVVNKRFLSVTTQMTELGCTVSVASIGSDNGVVNLVTFTAPSIEPVSLATAQPQQYISLRYTLTANGGNGRVVMSWQVRALPAPQREWLWRLPLGLYDQEVSAINGVAVTPGDPMVRLRALKTMESTGNTVIVQFLAWGERIIGVIEQVSFVSTTPPTGRGSGTGGIVNVTIREVAA